jgi:hypothetical protein
MTARRWNVDIEFHETDVYTHADVLLEAGDVDYRAFGRARRNPLDPNRPRIGEEIAAARALESLVSQLQGVAERDVEVFEGHPVEIQV